MVGKFIIFLLLAFALCGCNRQNRLPESIGQPYEVVLEGDTDSIVTKMLTEDVPALPQPEPMFNIIQVKKGKALSLYQSVRNRVIVDVDSRNAKFEVKVSKNVNFSPQVIIRVKARTVAQLKEQLEGDKLRRILDEAEVKHLASVIKQNSEKQKEVRKLFGIEMKIPMDMDASKYGKDFLWISNNANTGMQSLIFMKVKSDGQQVKSPLARLRLEIDSILRKNMLGETDGMYMSLQGCAEQGELTERGSGIERGLWEMKGDAMGGPYVMKIISHGKESVVVIGFVYAPEMKKRNLTKQLEAVLTTIK